MHSKYICATPHLSDFLATASQHIPQYLVGLTNKLHIAILYTIVHHLDEVARALVAHPVATRLAVTLGADRLEDRLQVRPGGKGRGKAMLNINAVLAHIQAKHTKECNKITIINNYNNTGLFQIDSWK